MTFRAKIVILGLLVLAGVGAALFVAYARSAKQDHIDNYTARARSVVLTAEAVRELEGQKWAAGIFNAAQMRTWADAGARDKLLAAVPFTPVPGPRVLAAAPAVRRALLERALGLVHGGDYSSLHVLFPATAEAAEGEALGMTTRHGVQFHWSNPGYRDFADFLAAFTHDKRKKVKQERRRLAEAGVTFERRCGRDIGPADWAFFFGCYERTYRAHRSTPYLTLAFFEEIGRTLADHLLLVVGSRAGQPLCAALDVFDGDALWGRYWGAMEYVPGLHFEACYYQAIDFCIERGIGRFEGGAQGLHKLARGLRPVPTHSLHAIGDPAFAAAIAEFCAQERVDVGATLDELEQATPFRDQESGFRNQT